MGPASKLLLAVDGKPLLVHALDALRAAALPPPVVVLGHRVAEMRAAIGERPATVVVAADFADGLSRSLAAGLAAAPASWRAALIVLGDMPRVNPATIAAIAAAAVADDSIVVPRCRGRRGNPVAWGRTHWPRLRALLGDAGARRLLADMAATELEVHDEGVLIDVDTPDDLARLTG